MRKHEDVPGATQQSTVSVTGWAFWWPAAFMWLPVTSPPSPTGPRKEGSREGQTAMNRRKVCLNANKRSGGWTQMSRVGTLHLHQSPRSAGVSRPKPQTEPGGRERRTFCRTHPAVWSRHGVAWIMGRGVPLGPWTRPGYLSPSLCYTQGGSLCWAHSWTCVLCSGRKSCPRQVPWCPCIYSEVLPSPL